MATYLWDKLIHYRFIIDVDYYTIKISQCGYPIHLDIHWKYQSSNSTIPMFFSETHRVKSETTPEERIKIKQKYTNVAIF